MSINSDLVERSKKNGINISQACTNYLISLNEAVEATLNGNNPDADTETFTKTEWCGRRDLNPGRQRGRQVDWQAYGQYLREKNYRGSYRSTLLGYAMQYGNLLLTNNLGQLSKMSDSKKANVLKAIASLSKFLGCYESFMQQRKDFGLTWSGKNADDLIIERLTKVTDSEEVWQWIKQAKMVRGDLIEFLNLEAVTGMRLVELVESYNLIVDLARKQRLAVCFEDGHYKDGYYNFGNQALEHFRFKEKFIRRSKKVFVSFVPKEIIEQITQSAKISSPHAVSASFRRNGFCSRFSDVREAHGTFMTKYLKASEIDFLHGRCATGTFMKHYFNPALIGDLKERSFKGIDEILEKIK